MKKFGSGSRARQEASLSPLALRPDNSNQSKGPGVLHFSGFGVNQNLRLNLFTFVDLHAAAT